MPLISCIECNKEISDQAASCPHCGAPSASKKPAKAKRKTHPITWVVVGLFIAAGIWFWQSPIFQDQYKPDMPVEVKHRPALLGPGLVLNLTNPSERQLNLTVELTNPGSGKASTFNVALVSGSTKSIGHAEGWVLEQGHKIKISHPDFKSWHGNIP